MEVVVAIITIAPRINEVCHDDAANVRAVLKEVQQKIVLVADVVESINQNVAAKNSMLLSQILHVFEKILRQATKTKNMNRGIYYLRGVHIQDSFSQMMESLRLYVESLKIAQVMPVTQKLNDFGDIWEDIEEDKSIKSMLRRERKQREEIQNMLRTGSLDINDLRRLGIAYSKSDVLNMLRQATDESDNLTQRGTTKAKIEAQNMDQLIKLLKQVVEKFDINTLETTSRPPHVKIPTCPVTFEPMDDPIIVDGKECKCCVSRRAFESWIRQSESNRHPLICPLCGGGLHSRKAQPNTCLIDIISDLKASHQNQQGADLSPSADFVPIMKPPTSNEAPEVPLKPQRRGRGAPNHGNEVELRTTGHDEENPGDANPSDPVDRETGEGRQKKIRFIFAVFLSGAVAFAGSFVTVYYVKQNLLR